MAVVGSTTAVLATISYTPPYQTFTYSRPTVQVTGTVTGSINNQPTAAPGTSDSDYAWTYLQAHMMSKPSYRYAYLLWMVLGLIAVIYTVAHHTRLSGGSLGAAYGRWGMRRMTIGSKKPGRRAKTLPSNSVLVTTGIVVIVTCVVCVIGADYINPSSSILDFSTSFKRAVQPMYTINKTFWTSASRFGFIAFALIPLVVLVALKAPPFAVLSLRPLAHLFADKLATFHRALGWLVWLLTTVHVALWSVQLFEDKVNGKFVWFVMWTNYRFIAGCAAYLFLTAMMVLGLRVIRKHRYEFFYSTHVVLVVLTLGCSAVHHPVLWYWMAAAGGVWVAERAYRIIRFAHTNAIFGGKGRVISGRPYNDLSDPQEYGMQDLKANRYSDKALPAPPEQPSEFGSRPSYYDEGSLQPLGSYEARLEKNYSDVSPGQRHGSKGYFQVEPDDAHSRTQSYATIPAPLSGPAAAPVIPAGYAQAQLLPSRTIRLTIRLPRPFKWAPGQSALLYLPEISRLQSHPFTIVNNIDENEIVMLVKSRKGITRRLFDIVHARSLKSISKDKRMSLTSSETVVAPPIFMRAWVDGPMGSAARVKWGDYSSVLIVCGGSGISFGTAICGHVCTAMAKQSRGWRTQRVRICWVAREYAEIAWVAHQLRRCQEMVPGSQLQIDIFVTRAPGTREDFAPPQPSFLAGARRPSMESIASEMSVDEPGLDIEESVDAQLSAQYADVVDLTNYEDEEDVNDPAEHNLSNKLQQQGKIRRAKTRRAVRASRKAQGSPSYPPVRLPEADYEDAEQQNVHTLRGSHYDAPRGSQYDTRGQHDPRGSQYDNRVQYDPRRLPSDNRGQYDPRGLSPYEPARGSQHELKPPPIRSPEHSLYAPQPLQFNNRHPSSRSLADSAYGRFDPFAGRNSIGTSPSPSLFFDDNQSMVESTRNLIMRQSRSQSMVLLEDNDPSGDSLWIDEADYSAMTVMSEMARPGKPKLGAVLEEEIGRSMGSMIVATCGPTTLNTVVRNLVSKHISPARIRHGDRRGHIAIYSEDYEG